MFYCPYSAKNPICNATSSTPFPRLKGCEEAGAVGAEHMRCVLCFCLLKKRSCFSCYSCPHALEKLSHRNTISMRRPRPTHPLHSTRPPVSQPARNSRSQTHAHPQATTPRLPAPPAFHAMHTALEAHTRTGRHALMLQRTRFPDLPACLLRPRATSHARRCLPRIPRHEAIITNA
jgi:hypothetical protein